MSDAEKAADYDSICDRCGSECNMDEKNMRKDGSECCNECYAELIQLGEENLD